MAGFYIPAMASLLDGDRPSVSYICRKGSKNKVCSVLSTQPPEIQVDDIQPGDGILNKVFCYPSL